MIGWGASWKQVPAAAATTRCSGYLWAMAVLLPTDEALQQLALLSGRESSDPAVVALFDQLVLRGHLKPFLPDWWEQIRWGQAERIARG